MPNIFNNTQRENFERIASEGQMKGLSANMDVRTGVVNGQLRALITAFHLDVGGTTPRILAPNASTTGVVDK